MGNAFQFEELEGKIGLVTFDVPGEKVNTFSGAVGKELGELVASLSKRDDLRGLLFRSGKSAEGQYIAGADLKELGAAIYAPKEYVAERMSGGHKLFSMVSDLPFPTVALIDGQCMGGGTELALSMDYRLAADNAKTSIGLPEVKIGVIPGWGGTQRLPRLIGMNASIDMICSGEPIDAAKAAKVGLVFDSVPADKLIDEGRRLIEYANTSGEWKESRKKLRQPIGLTDDQAMFIFSVSYGFLMGKTKGQYPAPLAALKAMKDGANLPLDEALKVEQKIALEVTGSPISTNLIGVFFLTQQLARDTGVDSPDVKPRDIRRVGVLGAGQMGAGIAAAHARSGFPSLMVDVDDKRIAAGLKSAGDVVSKRMQIGRATPQDLGQLFAMLNTSTSHDGFKECDIVIEAVTENEKLKTQIYKELTKSLRDDAILASNTSTISITRMAEATPHPERFIGMHFFYPVDRMQLVEVIRGKKTNDETVATVVALAKKIRKTPIVVNDCPGFLVNRILLPYMAEAIVLVLEGAAMDAVDKAAEKFGMPMGPMALHDLVGIDTSCYAGRVLAEAEGDRAVKITIMDDMVAAGRLGKKSGKGFRKYEGKKGKPSADPEFEPILAKHRIDTRKVSSEEITDRLFISMLFEGVRALSDGIVRQPGHVDMGLILGTGFPPFRGGILRWCDTEGADNIIARAKKYEPLGKRFEVPEMLAKMAAAGEKFYPRPKGI